MGHAVDLFLERPGINFPLDNHINWRKKSIIGPPTNVTANYILTRGILFKSHEYNSDSQIKTARSISFPAVMKLKLKINKG